MKTENVSFVLLLARAELDAGDHLDTKLRGGRARRGNTAHGVVVGQRDRRQANRSRLRDKLRWRCAAIGGSRVCMKINSAIGDGCVLAGRTDAAIRRHFV